MAGEIVKRVCGMIEGFKERNYNWTPEGIYAGHEEMLEIKLEQRGSLVDFQCRPGIDKSRIFIAGIPVYEVDVTSHLAVA